MSLIRTDSHKIKLLIFSLLMLVNFCIYAQGNTCEITPNNTTICVGESLKFSGSTNPSPSNPWQSSVASVATIDSNGQLKAVGAGSTVITFTAANGCMATRSLTVNSKPVISGQNSVCVQAKISLTSTNNTSGSTWTSATTNIASVNPSGQVTGIGAGLVDIIFTDANSCKDTLQVTVNALPKITGDSTLCVNSTITLTATGTPNSSAPWFSSNTGIATVSGTVSTSGTVTGKAEGNTTIRFTDNKGCASTKSIKVNRLIDITGPSTLCLKDKITFTTDESPTPSSPWQSSNTNAATINQSGQISTVALGTTNITYTSAAGCKTTKSLTILGLPNPIISLTNSSSNCSETDFKFTSNLSTSNFTFLWDFADGKKSTDPNPTHKFVSKGSNSQTFNVKLKATDNVTGCFNIDTLSVSVKQAPDIVLSDDFGFPIQDFRNCVNFSSINTNFPITFKNSSIGTISSFTIDWGDGTPLLLIQPFVSGQPFTHQYTTLKVFKLITKAFGANGCTSTKDYSVYNISNPDLGAGSIGSTTGCAPLLLKFPINTFEFNDSTTRYTIIPGSGKDTTYLTHGQILAGSFINSLGARVFEFSYNYSTSSCNFNDSQGNANSFGFKVIASNGCDIKNVTVGPIKVSTSPIAKIDLPPFACINKSVLIKNLTDAGSNISTSSGVTTCSTDALYAWNFGDGTTASTTSKLDQTHIYSTPGTYEVKLSVRNAGGLTCPPTVTTKTIVICANISTSQFSAKFSGHAVNSTTDSLLPGILTIPTSDCAPITVDLKNNTGNLCNTTFLWSIDSGPSGAQFTGGTSTSQATDSTKLTLPKGGTYVIKLVATNPCGSSTSYLKVIVPQAPAPAPVITSSTFYCNQNDITLSAASVPFATDYLWTITGVSPTANPTISVDRTSLTIGPFKLPTTGNYKATLKASNTCGSVESSVTFEVRPSPATAIANPAATSICKNSSVTLSSTNTSGTFQWFLDGTAISNAISSSYTVSNPGVISNTNQTYTVQQTVNGCSTVSTAQVITLRVAPSATITTSPTQFCPGVTINASITSTVTPSGTYTYTWFKDALATGTNSASLTATATGIYKLKADDGFCPVESNAITLSLFTLPTVTASASVSEICRFQSATLSASGATSYSWSPATGLNVTNTASVTASPAASTTYTVTATDGNGCKQDKTVALTVNQRPVVAISASATEICLDGVSKATLTASGATNGYVWSPATGLSATNLAVVTAQPTATTTYSVVGTDAKGCKDTTDIKITGRTKITASISSTDPQVFCTAGSVNATLKATTNPTRTYNYQWKQGATIVGNNSESLSTTTVGSYTVVISDTDNVCSTTTAPWVISIFNPGSITFTPSAPEVCKYQSVDITVSGANSYTWTADATLNTTSGASVTAKPLVSKSYTVEATDVNGCKQTASVSVTVLARPTVTVNNSKPTICLDGTDNTTLTAAGASTYQWITVTTGLSATTGAAVTAKPSANSTTYSVVGTDIKGCKDTTDVVVAGREKITASLSATGAVQYCPADAVNTTITANATPVRSFTYSWTKDAGAFTGTTSSITSNATGSFIATVKDSDNVCTTVTSPLSITRFTLTPITITPSAPEICKFQSTDLTASGANTYSWAPSTGLKTNNTATVTATPLSTTTYTVTATDVNSCIQTKNVDVKVNERPVVTVTNSRPTICLDGTDNTTLTASGATNGYVWSPAAGLSSTTGSTVTAKPTGATTDYAVVGTDAKGCKDTTTVTVTGREKITVDLSTSDPKRYCPDATVSTTLTATASPTRGYTFSWTKDGSTITGTTNTLTAVATGSYIITVKDTDNICSTASSPLVIDRFVLPAVSFSPANPGICKFNSIDVTVSGGNSYEWKPTTGLSATTTDKVTASPLATTTYTVTVTDANTCKQDKTVTVQVNDRPVVTVTNSKPTICLDGTDNTTLTASGASTYQWIQVTTGLSATTGAVVTAKPTANSTTYSVVGTDPIGCQDTTTVIVAGREKIIVDLTTSDPKRYCPGATVNSVLTVTATPSRSFNFTWTRDGAGITGTTSTLTANSTGTYIATVKDTDNVCTISTAGLVIDRFVLPDITFNPATPEICKYQSVPLSISGADSYVWTPNDRLSATTGSTVTASPLATRVYSVTATDVNSCSQVKTIEVKVNQLPVVNVSATKTGICQGQTTTLSAIGALTYAWSPSTALSALTGATVTANPTSTITYEVIGTDVKSCQDTTTIKINVSDAIKVTIATSDPIQFCTDPEISTLFKATATPKRPYNFVWLKNNSPIAGATDTSFTAKSQGSYKIRVSDSVCETDSDPTLISLFSRPVIAFNPVSPQAICRYDSITLEISGAKSYAWAPATGLNVVTGAKVKASPAATQTYTVSTIDNNNCTKDLSFTLNVNQLPTVIPSADENDLCFGTSTTLRANGAATYLWSPATGLSGTTGAALTAGPLASVKYSIVGTDSKGCKDTAEFNLKVRPQIPAAISTTDITTFCTPAEIKALLVTDAVAGFTYEWFLENASLPTSNNPTYLATLAGNYKVKVSDADLKCNRTSSLFKIGVFDREKLAINPAQPGICRGDFVTITASGADTYTWKNSLETDRTGTAISVSPANDLEFFLKSIDKFNCPDSLKFTVEVNDVPVVKIDAPDTELCIGESTGLKSSGADLYHWSPAVGLSSVTDSIITANPTSSQTYQVIGRSFYGCSDTTTVRITVFQLPTLSAGSDGTYCDNFGLVALDNNTGLTPSGGIWTGTAVFPGNQFDPSTAAIGTNTLIYTVTDPATGCKNSDNAILTVRKPPAVNFTMPERICINVPVNLPNTTPAFSGNSLSYGWDYGNGGVATSTNGSTVFTVAGTYNVKLVATATPDRCFNEIIKPILAVDPPVANFSRSVPSETLCGPIKILFGNQSTGTDLTYRWNFGNGVTSTTMSPDSVLFEPNAYVDTTYQMSLVVTSGEPTCPVVQKADSVVLRPNPTAKFLFTQNPICADFPLDINNFSFGKGTQFLWNFGDGSPIRTDLFTGTIQHIFRNNTRKDTIFTVTLSVSNECKTSILERDITVTPNKVVAFYEATVVQGCEPLTVEVKSNQIAASKNELIWDWGDGTFTNGGLTTSHTYDKFGEYLPKLTVRNGCNVDTCRFDGLPSCGVKVNVLKSPRPTFEVNNPVCFGQKARVVNQTLDQITSTWNFGDGSPAFSDFGSPSFQYADVGNYTIIHEVSYNNGCRSSFSRPVEVVPLPKVDFRAPAICADQAFTIQNLSSNAQSFIWKLVPDDPKLISLDKDLQGSIPGAGLYPLRLIAFTKAGQTGCTDSLTRLVSVGRVPKPEFVFNQVQRCDSLQIKVDNLTSYPDPEDGKFTWSIGPFLLSELANPDTLTYIYSYSTDREAELKLSVQSINGCIDSVKQTIQIPAFDEKPRIPPATLAFVPDDPINGKFRLDTDNASGRDFVFSVYSQWGNELFRASKRNATWDGKYQGAVAPPGAYVAHMEYRGCRTGRRYTLDLQFMLLMRAN